MSDMSVFLPFNSTFSVFYPQLLLTKVNLLFQSDRTALFLASEEGNLEAVMRLIDMRCNVTIKDKVGFA